MTFPYIVIDHDKVRIEGVIVPRPTMCNVTDWMDFWESARSYDSREDNPDTISELKARVAELESSSSE